MLDVRCKKCPGPVGKRSPSFIKCKENLLMLDCWLDPKSQVIKLAMPIFLDAAHQARAQTQLLASSIHELYRPNLIRVAPLLVPCCLIPVSAHGRERGI